MNIFRIEAEQLRHEPITLKFSESAALFGLEDEELFRYLDPVEGEVIATHAGTAVVLVGEVRTVVTASCARCLEEIKVPFSAQVGLSFTHNPRLMGNLKVKDELDDEAEFYDGEIVAPAPQLRELLLLELPEFPICQGELVRRCDAILQSWKDEAHLGAAALPVPVVEDGKPNPWKDQIDKARQQLEKKSKR